MKNKKIETQIIHGNKQYPFTGPVVYPIYQTSNFRFKNSSIASRYSKGDESVFVYSRIHNPTVNQLEQKFTELYDNKATLFCSGMAAISTTILALCKSDEEILTIPNLYGGTYHYFNEVLPKFKIDIKTFEPNSLEDLLYLITPKTRIVYFETPTNPTINLVDIQKLVKIVKKIEKEYNKKIYTILDNTFATILNQNPFKYGVDIVIESTTKYLGGHSDLIGGLVVSSNNTAQKIKNLRKYTGSIMEPFTAFLLDRSLKTFLFRVKQQNQNAIELAKALEKHRNIIRVLYPGLKSHPNHELAKKQMRGFGGMLTIEVVGGLKNAIKFCNNLKLAVNAMSLGGVETSVSIPVLSSHIGLTKSELTRQGVTEGMVRISTGIENIVDLIQDFYQSLNKLK